MPSKKKKYNARFPAGRIKKIMQMDDDVGKIAHAVPVVISRSVELFINSLLNHTANITREKNAKTVSLSHTKHCILKEQKFEFLKDLVKNIADVGPEEEKKTSKASSVSPEHSNEALPEKSRKRSAPDSHGSESAGRHGSESRASKKRYSESEKNSSSSSKENSKTVSCSSRNSFNDSPNNKSENISKDLENSSYDLIIDETRDT